MMKNLIYTTICLIAVFLFSCQEDTITPEVFGTLVGQVVFEGNNLAIENASISTNPPTSTVLTDNLGRFSIDNIKTGSYTIRAEKSSLLSAIETVTIFEGKTTNVVIQMTEADESNTPPDAPKTPGPANGKTGLGIELTLSWEAIDADDDVLTYDVYLFNSLQSPNTLIAENLTENTLPVDGLKYGITYFWQVVIKDGKADPVYGEVWQFSVGPFPNHPFVFTRVNNGKYDIFGAQSANPNLPLYQLTELPGSNYRPRISPSGHRIAFLSNNFPNTQLYTMKRDGTDITLVQAPVPVDGNDKFQLDFAWSPDGTKLLYMNEERLYRINLDGSGFELFAELNTGEEFVEVDWAPVTHKIAARTVGSMPYQSRILLYDENGNFLQEVVTDLPGNTGGPAFSVAGNSLLYTQDVAGLETPDGRQLNTHIFLKNLNTGAVTDLSVEKEAGYNDLDPRFSPNGALVIFVHTNNVPNSPKDIYTMNLDGEGRTLLFENAEMPDWR